jgi:hypothetical protein
VLAAALRGKVLTRLTEQRKVNPNIFDDDEEFREQLRKAIDLPDEAKITVATGKYQQRRRTASVRAYAVRCTQLQLQLGIPE